MHQSIIKTGWTLHKSILLLTIVNAAVAAGYGLLDGLWWVALVLAANALYTAFLRRWLRRYLNYMQLVGGRQPDSDPGVLPE